MTHTSDTLCAQSLQAYMRSIEVCGRTYGLSLNFDKIEALPVKCLQTIQNSDGSAVKTKECLKYLGCSLDSNGRMMGELKQKIAIARDEFNQLSKVWNHTTVFVKVKRAVFQQCIISKYGFESAWLTKEERKKLVR